MDAVKKALKMRRGIKEIRYGDMFFEKKNRLYEPIQDWDLGSNAYLSSYFVRLERSLPLLRKSILDESLPLYVYGMPDLFCGGRITDVLILGMFEYLEANPELLEVAQHDLDYEMRASSVTSIGEMGRRSFDIAPSLCSILRNDKRFYVKNDASEALGKIGNPIANNYLRDSFDEARYSIKDAGLRGYPFQFETSDPWEKKELDSACLLLERSIISLLKLDPISGREILSIGLSDSDQTVYHWSKKAAFWFEYLKD